MEEKTILAEDNQDSIKLNLKESSKNSIDRIEQLLVELKTNFNNDDKFYDILRSIHGMFSKVELNLIDLEKLKNVGI